MSQTDLAENKAISPVAWGVFRDGEMVGWVPGPDDPETCEFRLPEDDGERRPLYAAPYPASAMVKASKDLVDKAVILSGVVEGRLTDELAAAMGIKPSVWEPTFDELLEMVRDRFQSAPTA